jgi:DNA-binding XRE family transcriptional regulator
MEGWRVGGGLGGLSVVPVAAVGAASAPAHPVALVAGLGFASGGLAPLLVPANDLERWGKGVPSETTRAALRHELQARGLTQDRLARQVGLSRPQLTNLLRGRVGTSPEAAARLKAFLLEAA